MTFYPSQNLDTFTVSAATSSESGSRDLDYVPHFGIQAERHLMKGSSGKLQALGPELTFTFGTPDEQLPCSTQCAIHGPFTIRSGQEVLDSDGNTIAWTTDPWVAQVICKVMTDYINNETKGL